MKRKRPRTLAAHPAQPGARPPVKGRSPAAEARLRRYGAAVCGALAAAGSAEAGTIHYVDASAYDAASPDNLQGFAFDLDGDGGGDPVRRFGFAGWDFGPTFNLSGRTGDYYGFLDANNYLSGDGIMAVTDPAKGNGWRLLGATTIGDGGDFENYRAFEDKDGNGSWAGGGRGYAGLRLAAGDDDFYYGWAQFYYDDAGDKLSLIDFALQTELNKAIGAGERDTPTPIDYSGVVNQEYMSEGEELYLDLDGDGIADFSFWGEDGGEIHIDSLHDYRYYSGIASVPPLAGGELFDTWNWDFTNTQTLLEGYGGDAFADGGEAYLALRVPILGEDNSYRYGWARLDVDADKNSVTLVDYALETTPNRFIFIGDQGAASVPEPSSLLLAASGAAGIAALRRRRKERRDASA